MTLTSSGPRCDVCGRYILPGSSEAVNFFGVAQIPDETLCCHDECKAAVLTAGDDWTALPSGPLRSVYERAAMEMEQR